MLTTSLEFAFFLPIVFILYWYVLNKRLRWQNTLMVIASYVFYGWWDWRFLFLIIFSSTVDYLVGLGLNNTENQRKRILLLSTSIIANLSLLGFFKYYNFFLDSFVEAFTFFGYHLQADRLDVILPVGISFYTLQTLSYTIDVYNRKLKGTKDIISFFAYVSFFPQLVAGPIERATHLLPQFQNKRTFDYHKAADGMRQILWGLFKKMVIADNLAAYTGSIFTQYDDYSGSTLLFGLFMLSVQFYCDFSGYSDIAIGTGRLFGFNLMKNFNFPFFSRNIAELWQRWHISLITWLRDYLVKHFKGRKKWQLARNVFIIFLITGFWHGANWTYIVWGIMNGLFFMTIIFAKERKKYKDVVAKGRLLPTFKEAALMVRTFVLFSLTGAFFGIASVGDGLQFWAGMLDLSLFSMPQLPPKIALVALLFMLGVEWLQREKDHGLDLEEVKFPLPLKWGFYYSLVIVILYFGGDQQDFLYFQF